MTEDAVLARLRQNYAVTIADLAASLGLPRREIEAQVEALRLAGVPIIGGNDGLRLTDDPAELREYARARRRRLATISRGTRQLLRTARRMEERTALTLGLTA